MMIVYGIKQCDTCRKARKWLDSQGIAHEFHDLRVDGFDRELLDQWLQSTSVNTLINRRSTTWRALPEQYRQDADDRALAGILVAHPTLIKRPVFYADQVVAVGFQPDELAGQLAG